MGGNEFDVIKNKESRKRGKGGVLTTADFHSQPLYSAPVVEDVKVICDRHSSMLQVDKGADNVAVLHVPGRIVISTDNKEPGMAALRCLNQVVQVEDIIRVTSY